MNFECVSVLEKLYKNYYMERIDSNTDQLHVPKNYLIFIQYFTVLTILVVYVNV